MAFRDVVGKMLQKDPRFKEMQRERRMQQIIEEREKGADERELERFYEEERQKSIKKNLDEFRKKRQEEFMHGNNILKTKNIFKGHKNILDQDKSVLDNGKGILNDKKLFTVGHKQMKGRQMFFK